MAVSRVATEVRHLLWLQGRLMRSSLRSGKRQDILRILGFLLLALLLIPGILCFNAWLVWIYRTLEVGAASEVLVVILSFVILSWLLTPTSNTQLVEPFSVSKLFQLPISLAGLVIGSLAITVFSVGFLTTLPFVLALVAGMARGAASIPALAITGILFLLAVVVLKAIIDDVFDLIAEDRRLRMIAILIALLPVILLVGGQLYFQASLMQVSTESARVLTTMRDVNEAIVSLGLSSYLSWHPGGWVALAARAAARGAFQVWAAWTLLLAVFVVLGYVVHYSLLRRLYFGELVRAGYQKQAGHSLLSLRTPRLALLSRLSASAFWGLLKADWRGFVRNPYTVRMAIAPVVLGLMAVFFSATAPLPSSVMGGFIGAMAVLVLTMGYSHNVFAILDSPGLGTVLLAPVRLRWLLLSHNAILTVVVLVLAGTVGFLVAVLQRQPVVLLTTLGAALGLQLPMLSVGNLTAVFLPYKIDLEKGRAAANEGRASALSVFAVMGGSSILYLPALALVLLPLALWPQVTVLGILAAVLYVVGVYAGGFFLAAHALERRGDQVLAAISEAP